MASPRPPPRRRPKAKAPAGAGAHPSKPSLSRQRVIRAAVRELDDRGLAAFSIRNLAHRLGVYPAAIYWHVASRDLVLAEVVAHVLGAVEPRADLAWQRYLRELFARYRASIKNHPNMAPLVGAHLIGNRSIRLSLVERVLAKLGEAGFGGLELVAAYNTVIAALVGFVTQEFAPIPEDRSAEWQAAVEARVQAVDVAGYPVLAANLPLLANRAFILRWQSGAQVPLDHSFDRYVDVVIGGLERLAADRGKRKRR